MAKKIPMRTCIGCGQSKEKRNLIRIVHSPDGSICMDLTGRAPGRGAYLCKDPACFDKAMKKGAFTRAFQTSLPAEDAKKSREQLERAANSDSSGKTDAERGG